MGIVSEELELGGKFIRFETGKLAKAADGAVLVQSGGTTVLVTAVISKDKRNIDFLPLTVDVEEKMYAAGKIPGGFIKREGRPSDKSILTARLIDRPIRPSFPKSFRNDVQIIATVLAVDMVNPPDVLALCGASQALALANAPCDILAGVRVCRVQGEWVVNPNYEEIDLSDLDLVVAGNKNAISMVESGASEVDEEVFLEGFEKAHEAIAKLIDFQSRFKAAVAPPDRTFEFAEPDSAIEEKVRNLAEARVAGLLDISDRTARKDESKKIKQEVLDQIEAEVEDEEAKEAGLKQASGAYKAMEKAAVRNSTLAGKRSDGRRPDEIRDISCETATINRTHGSGLFTRGGTQVLSLITLGTVSEGQRLDGLDADESKRFFHHYNFPPFSTGETWILRGPKRRDVGHGALAEKALSQVIPEEQEFPYTIRAVSEVLESNGSTSMASVCASTLALMDAGVPIRAPVAGIAMGLVKDGDRKAILTDILGEEDAIGDMDFKVAGTRKGITALQMDIKLAEGLDRGTLREALFEAKKAREFILGKIEATIEKPRAEVSEYAPRIITLRIDKDKIREVIGPGGKVINSIIEETGVAIDIEDDGTVYIASQDAAGGEKAKEIVEMITKVVKVGEKYMGTVMRTTDFGAFVEILPGREGLVHISKLARHRVAKVEDVVKE
ncbi:MAG: polyribonucleotide nucleotidyltransferase, partial [Terriglobia bacterium]